MGFSKRITVTVTSDSSKVPSNHSDYPLYIDITDPALKTVSEGGFVTDEFFAFDVVAFADAELTQMLPFEAEVDSGLGYNGAAGRWRGHVKIDIEPGKVFYLGVGNSAITTRQGNHEDVWPSGYKLVSHLHNQAGIGQGADSTANNIHGVATGTTRANDGNAQLYLGLNFDGSVARVDYFRDDQHYATLTVSGWVKADTTAAGQRQILCKGYDGTNTEWQLYIDGDKIGWNSYDGTTHGIAASDFTLTADEEVYVVGTYDGTNWRLYIDNVEDANSPVADIGPVSTGNKITAGAVDTTPFGYIQFWSGVLDEIRIFEGVLAADRRTIDFESQDDPGTFVSFEVSDALASDHKVGSLFALFQ